MALACGLGAVGHAESERAFGELLDRKLNQACQNLFNDISVEIATLRDQTGAVARELQMLRGCSPDFLKGAAVLNPLAVPQIVPPLDAIKHIKSNNKLGPAVMAISSMPSLQMQRDPAEISPRSLRHQILAQASIRNTRSAASGSHSLRGAGSQSSSLQQEDLDTLRRAFSTLCRRRKNHISITEIIEMSAKQQGIRVDDPRVSHQTPRFEAAISWLNEEMVIEGDATIIVLQTFIAIMQRSAECFTTAEDEMLDSTWEIREILVREDAMRKVAKATHIDTVELTAARMREPKTLFARAYSYLDSVIGLVIILNALVIYISTDYDKQYRDVWQVFEISFSLIFMTELALRLVTNGLKNFFLGQDRTWNIFDSVVVSIAMVDLFFMMIGELVVLRDFTLIRLLRFARLTRLVRVLKLKVFKELALLVGGILAGFRTLVWSIVFLAFLLFALGVFLTQSVGRMEKGSWDGVCDGLRGDQLSSCIRSAQHLQLYSKELFGTVLRSMFTVFRCFTDGCESVDGTPLVPYFYNTHGSLVVMMYMLILLFVTFGLFNLIMAIFVENTIDNAKHDDARRRAARQKEHLRVAKQLQKVIMMICRGEEDAPELKRGFSRGGSGWWAVRESAGPWNPRHSGDKTLPGHEEGVCRKGSKASTTSVASMSVQVTRHVFGRAMHKPEVQELLDELDISISNRAGLFDILDANCDGTLEVAELVEGLLKLRGHADKGDMVAPLLAIRAIQKTLKDMEALSLHQQRSIDSVIQQQMRMGQVLLGLDPSLLPKAADLPGAGATRDSQQVRLAPKSNVRFQDEAPAASQAADRKEKDALLSL